MKRQNKVALDNKPRFTITVTDESCWLTRHDAKGKPYLTYPVLSSALGAVFNGFEADTGLIPEGCLFWQNKGGRNRVAIWIPPGPRQLFFAGKKGKSVSITIPLPGFVFVGDGPRYSIFAAKSRPASIRDRLYHAPLPNVGSDGSICAGSVRFPECSMETINEAARLFFVSEFNGDLDAGKMSGQKGSLFNALKALKNEPEFPHVRLISGGPFINLLDKNKEIYA